MKIINGPKWLNLASSTRSIKLAPLTVSDNMIADRQLLATLMTTFKPGEFLIFMDSSLELSTFTSLDLGTKTGLKDQFLCTDIESGIAKMITPYEEAAAKEAEAAKKAQLEAEEMASYKGKYESAQAELVKVKSNAKIALEEVENRNNQVTRLHDELDSANSTITELRTALQSAADKIESMKNEFNAACQKFAISRGAEGEWKQDFEKTVPEDKLLVSKTYIEQSDAALKELTAKFNNANTELAKLKSENKAQDQQIIKLHTEIGTICAKFNIVKSDNGEYEYMTNEIATPIEEVKSELENPATSELETVSEDAK